MSRGRRIQVAVGLGLVVALVGLGLWRRNVLIVERAQARAATARARTHLESTRQKIASTIATARGIEADARRDHDEAESLTAVAEGLAGEIRGVEQQRDDATVSAWYSGAQIGSLRECLAGVNRALNQISVGDTASGNALTAVRSSCRAVGA